MTTGAPSARDAILERLGYSLGRDARGERETAVDAWVARDSRPPRPARAISAGTERTARFVAESRRNGATVIEIDALIDLPGALAGYMRDHNLGGAFRVAATESLADVDWSSDAMLMPDTGPASPSDVLSVSSAVAGAAETGSVMFVSGPETPATLHVLPLHHVSVIHAGDIEGGYEDAVARARRAAGVMPRVLNIITGPSRTADIEQTLLMGAHGPQAEVVIVVGSS